MRSIASAIIDFEDAFVNEVSDALNAINANELVYEDMAHSMINIDPAGKTSWDTPEHLLHPDDTRPLQAMDEALENLSFEAISRRCGFQAGWHVLQAFHDMDDVQGSISVVFNASGKVRDVLLIIEDVHLFETFMRHGMEPIIDPEPGAAVAPVP